jgi:hypothetical protein
VSEDRSLDKSFDTHGAVILTTVLVFLVTVRPSIDYLLQRRPHALPVLVPYGCQD